MTIVPPAPGEPRRPDGPRDSGDAWVIAPDGAKYWGRYGAAGLLAVDAERGVLLQHRVGWSHHGGTWGLPGGALHEGESAGAGALREAQEEAGIPDGAVAAKFSRTLDLGVWSYTTVVADVIAPFDPVISDHESLALEWVPVEQVEERPLHPGFASAWPQLRDLLATRAVVVVDAANVVGSVPDGWWKDRAGAAGRLRDRLGALRVPAAEFDLPGTTWHPEIVMVVEGQARAVPDAMERRITVVRAEGEGDDTIVAEARRATEDGAKVLVVTSDRGLRERVDAVGAESRSVRWLTGLLDEA